MHTTEELDASDFTYLSGGRTVPEADCMPSVSIEDRLGVVMEAGGDGTGAGSFVLASVTAFYDRLRETTDDFFEYPDYYTVQATSGPADYRMLDIWPDHKNVAVPAEPESVLRAIVDRAITVLLVPDRSPRSPDVDDVTHRSANRRIERCYLYGPDGSLDEPAFSIRHPREPADRWFETTIESMGESGENPNPSWGATGEYIEQDFREVPLEDALRRLPSGDGSRQ